MYKILTNNKEVNFQKFFEFKNSFHLPQQTSKIYYINEETGDIKEIDVEAQQINIDDFVEGDELETVFVFVPEIAELQYYVIRVKNILE